MVYWGRHCDMYEDMKPEVPTFTSTPYRHVPTEEEKKRDELARRMADYRRRQTPEYKAEQQQKREKQAAAAQRTKDKAAHRTEVLAWRMKIVEAVWAGDADAVRAVVSESGPEPMTAGYNSPNDRTECVSHWPVFKAMVDRQNVSFLPLHFELCGGTEEGAHVSQIAQGLRDLEEKKMWRGKLQPEDIETAWEVLKDLAPRWRDEMEAKERSAREAEVKGTKKKDGDCVVQ